MLTNHCSLLAEQCIGTISHELHLEVLIVQDPLSVIDWKVKIKYPGLPEVIVHKRYRVEHEPASLCLPSCIQQ